VRIVFSEEKKLEEKIEKILNNIVYLQGQLITIKG